MSWYRCSVQRVGPAEDGKVYIWLRDENPVLAERKFDHWFVPPQAIAQSVLAVGLTAITSGLLVDANIGETEQYSRVDRLYVIR